MDRGWMGQGWAAAGPEGPEGPGRSARRAVPAAVPPPGRRCCAAARGAERSGLAHGAERCPAAAAAAAAAAAVLLLCCAGLGGSEEQSPRRTGLKTPRTDAEINYFGAGGALEVSYEFSDQDSLQGNDQRHSGGVKPKFNVNQVEIAQVVSYNLSRGGQWGRTAWRRFPHSHYSALNVTVSGTPCILFWAKRIMMRFENHTQLDLTEKTFGVHATVDVGDSNCSEDSAMVLAGLMAHT